MNLQIVANKSLMLKRRMKSETGDLKGVLAKNERGFILLLILLLSVVSMRRKWLKNNSYVSSMQIQKVATFNSDRKKINLNPDKYS